MPLPNNVAKLIEAHEGRRACAYKDSLGFDTIGVGHLVDSRRTGAGLPDVFIDALLQWDIQQKTAELEAAMPWVATLDEVRHAALVDMAFNLGVHGLSGFMRFLAALKTGDYEAAANEMLASKWATQVGARAHTLSSMIRYGTWPDR